ncbi:MAG TPA: hypothetical protein VNE82_09215 [Candidatus Binataceae bacterium]|nr:hypothetical protein [Candidatus Binataceae bacterium]HVB80103.1 hypothetical protein [Candidatus Binataceae bacterium]
MIRLAFGRKLRWLTSTVIAMALVSALFLGFDLVHPGSINGAVQDWQKILEALGTIAVAMLVLWREYLRDEAAAPRAEHRTSQPPAPQIVQNIYPPSAAPAASRATRATDLRESEEATQRIVEDAGQVETGVVKARRLVIVDEQGRERIFLGLDGAGAPAIGIRDERGTMRATLSLLENGQATLQLLDGEQRTRASLAVRRDGFGELALLDRAGAIRAALGAAGDDAISYLGLRAACTYALVLEGRQVSQSLWNEAARLEWSLPIRPSDE